MKTTSYTLEVGKKLPPEQWAREGKPESSAIVRIEIDLDRALEVARLIIVQAQNRRERGELVDITLRGELRTEDDE